MVNLNNLSSWSFVFVVKTSDELKLKFDIGNWEWSVAKLSA